MEKNRLIRTCSIWRSLEVVGDTSTLLILEASWLGARRFDDFLKSTGLLRALLSDRLKKLVVNGLLEKAPTSDKSSRHKYVMTQKGKDLFWTSLALLRWELEWGGQGDHISVSLRHTKCGHDFLPVVACRSCKDQVDITQIDWLEGPGVGWMAPVYSRRRQQRASSEAGSRLFEQGAQLMGDRWASLIMRSISTGINKFDEIRQDTSIATNILAERLSWLESISVIKLVQYESNPPRFQYKPTRKGMSYAPVLTFLMQWGDKYYVSPEGPPVLLQHHNCGHLLTQVVLCSECHAEIDYRETQFTLMIDNEPTTLALTDLA